MQENHEEFIHSSRKHILMLTTHGVHEWDVVPGLTDTGGQNVFVNQFSAELAQQGYKITIANRGGYPHPVTGRLQTGVVYKHPFQRIIYLEDGLNQFVRKEDMDGQVQQLASSLEIFLDTEHQNIDLLISHYWDAAVVAEIFRSHQSKPIPHVWVPHSLGEIKKSNVAPGKWRPLRIEERIRNELEVLSKIDFAASTSPIISDSLLKDYRFTAEPLWLPPCVSTERYYPHDVPEDADIWHLLHETTNLQIGDIREMKTVTEISRTDTTKRKDILLKAFAQTVEAHPNTLLVVTIEKDKKPIGPELIGLINELGLQNNVAVLGSVWDILPDIYAISHLYCTPSIMEGFGMSAQEAAATGVPVIASSLVPFITQYLHRGSTVSVDETNPISVGDGAIIVQPDHISGFSQAMSALLSDESQRKTMGNQAYQITIPRFTWPRVVRQFLKSLS
jgi:mannosylfructose-phosphate synthase